MDNRIDKLIDTCEKLSHFGIKLFEDSGDWGYIVAYLKELKQYRENTSLSVFHSPFSVLFKAEESIETKSYEKGYCFTSDSGVVCIYKGEVPDDSCMVALYNWDCLVGVIN